MFSYYIKHGKLGSAIIRDTAVSYSIYCAAEMQSLRFILYFILVIIFCVLTVQVSGETNENDIGIYILYICCV